MTAEIIPSQYPEATPTTGFSGEAEEYTPAQQIHGTSVVYGAVTEYTAEVPHHLVSDEVIVWNNGFGAFKKTMRGIGRETAKLGYANVRLKPIRRSGRTATEKWHDATQIHVDALDAVLENLASNPALQDVEHGDELNFDSLILASHSYGGKTGKRYALAHPEKVSKVIGVETVGEEDPELLRFLGRLPVFVRTELIPFVTHHGPDFSPWDLQKALDYMFSDPMQTIGEMRACFLADDRLDYYRLRAHGIGTALLTGSHDSLIPAGPIETAAAHMVDYYEQVEGNHLGPQQHPERFARAVVRAIHVLNEQRKPQLSVVDD
jgi:Predicted hydrolases or acyltransferases (alpha/beta hydrolase superfamily)